MLKTKEEQILRMLCRLERISRRRPLPPPGEVPPPGPPPSPRPGPAAGRALAILDESGAMNQAQLARELDIRPQSLSELLGKLESDGMIVRQQSESDKRQTIVTLTEQGRTRIAEFHEKRRQEAEDFLADLSEEEKDELYVLLKKLIDSHRETKATEPEEIEKF